MSSAKASGTQTVESATGAVLKAFAVKESEDTWTAMDETLARFTLAVKAASATAGGREAVAGAAKKAAKSVFSVALMSERTRLSRTGLACVAAVAAVSGDRFDAQLSDALLPFLLKLCTRANRVIVSGAADTLKTVISCCGVPHLLALLVDPLCAPSPSKSLRIVAAECVIQLLDANPVNRLERYVDAIEAIVKAGAVDSTPEVRTLVRTAFEDYRELFPDRVDKFAASLSEVAAKYLKINKTASAAPMSRIVPSRPRAGTASSTASTFVIPPSRTATVTPDSLSRNATAGDDDDAESLQSETPSFTVEGDMGERMGGKPRAKSAQLENASNLKQHPQRSASVVVESAGPPAGGARRMPMERPARDFGLGPTTHLTEHIGGAQRVPKSVKSAGVESSVEVPPVISKPKAMRVPAAAAPSAESGVRPPSVAEERGDVAHPAPSTTSRLPPASAASKVIKKPTSLPKSNIISTRPGSISSTPSSTIDLTDANSKLKSTDWSIRHKTLESLASHISTAAASAVPAPLAADMRARSPKYCTLLLTGLNDNNTKCVQTALQGLRALFDGAFASPDMLDAVVPRVAAIVYYQPAKGKREVVLAAEAVVVAVVERFGMDACAAACVHALHRPEYGKSVRVRGGAVAMLAEMSEDEWGVALGRGSNVKLYMTRLLSIAGDPDTTVQKALKVCLAALQSLAPDAFWAVWANAKASEKKAVNALFQTTDIAYSKRELEMAKKTNATGIDSSPQRLAFSPVSKLRAPSRLSVETVRSPMPSAISKHNDESTLHPPNEEETGALRHVDLEDIEEEPEGAEQVVGINAQEIPVATEAIVTSDGTNFETEEANNEVSSEFEVQEQDELEDAFDGEVDSIPSRQPSRLEALFMSNTPVRTADDSEIAMARTVSHPVPSAGRIGGTGLQSTVPRLSSKLPAPLMGRSSSVQSGITMTRSGSLPVFSSPFKQATNKTPTLVSPFSTSMRPGMDTWNGSDSALRPRARPASTLHQSAAKSISLISYAQGDENIEYSRIREELELQEDPETRFEKVVESDMRGLALFVLDRRNMAVLGKEGRVDVILNVVMTRAEEQMEEEGEIADIKEIKAGILILKYVVQNFHVDARASDVLKTLLMFERKPLTTTDDHLELEYEVDSMIAVFTSTFKAKLLLTSAADALESLPEESINSKLCFELTAHALSLTQHGDEDASGTMWNRVIGFVAQGLDSKNVASRKAAFDCAVALGLRQDGILRGRLYEEVGVRSGRGREAVVRGMLERKLAIA
ncbi:clasp N terminal-domain-containing protein [Chytriomyces sp. MP71]|nr:clasp N terminal-domain-containing protein [Chytriomyces sp. MP71]